MNPKDEVLQGLWRSTQNFLSEPTRNLWLCVECDLGITKVYVRKSRRYLGNKFLAAFDIASISLDPEIQKLGIFSGYMNKLEQEAETLKTHGLEGIYLENALNENLYAYMKRRPGWGEVSPQCFFFRFP